MPNHSTKGFPTGAGEAVYSIFQAQLWRVYLLQSDIDSGESVPFGVAGVPMRCARGLAVPGRPAALLS